MIERPRAIERATPSDAPTLRVPPQPERRAPHELSEGIEPAPAQAQALPPEPPLITGARTEERPRRTSVAMPPLRHAGRSMGTAAPSQPGEDGAIERSATAPQLRRFIKSRAYVPMHELRRRFAINGGDDEVTAVDIDRQRVFVGLPEREGRLLGELLRGGDIG